MQVSWWCLFGPCQKLGFIPPPGTTQQGRAQQSQFGIYETLSEETEQEQLRTQDILGIPAHKLELREKEARLNETMALIHRGGQVTCPSCLLQITPLQKDHETPELLGELQSRLCNM